MGTLKLMTELIVGFSPDGPGWVRTVSRAEAAIGGTIDLSMNSIYAFLTGSRPGETKPLRPSTFISTRYSSNFTTAESSRIAIIFTWSFWVFQS